MKRATPDFPPSPSESPVRAALAEAIEAHQGAWARLEQASGPVERLERSRSGKIERLKSRVDALRAGHEASVVRWLREGGRGEMPETPADLAGLELSLAEMSSGASVPEHVLDSARDDLRVAAEEAQGARVAVEAALWPAVADAVKPAVVALEDAIKAALELEGHVRAVIFALREEANRDEKNGSGAFLAASQIEGAVLSARRIAVPLPRADIGRELIKRLRSDASAAFEFSIGAPSA